MHTCSHQPHANGEIDIGVGIRCISPVDGSNFTKFLVGTYANGLSSIDLTAKTVTPVTFGHFGASLCPCRVISAYWCVLTTRRAVGSCCPAIRQRGVYMRRRWPRVCVGCHHSQDGQSCCQRYLLYFMHAGIVDLESKHSEGRAGPLHRRQRCKQYRPNQYGLIPAHIHDADLLAVGCNTGNIELFSSSGAYLS